MSRREQVLLTLILIFIDAFMIVLALATAYYVRVESGWLPGANFSPFSEYMRASVVIIFIWLLIFALNHLYDVHLLLEGLQEYVKVLTGCTYGVLALILTAAATSPGAALPARGWILLTWVFSILFVWTARFITRRIITLGRGRGRFVTRALIVGANAHGQALATQFRSTPSARVEVVGFVDDFLPAGARVGDLTVLGPPAQLTEIAARYDAREVIVVSTALAWETFQQLMQQASTPLGFEILLSPGYYEILATGVEVRYRDFVPLLRLNQTRLTGPDAIFKAVVDVFMGLLMLIFAAPFMVLIALAIRTQTKQPPLERHAVWGVRGSSFYTYKFNTNFGVSTASLAASLPTVAHPLAKWLLRLGLDKLPQLINIALGRMSLVGPRTISRSRDILIEPTLANLLTVKPGITGPWAVGGERTFEEEVRLTNYYIRNWTIWLDLQIIAQTVVRILRGERAKAQLPLSDEDYPT